jgi:pyrroline-5-carboxylate reductase
VWVLAVKPQMLHSVASGMADWRSASGRCCSHRRRHHQRAVVALVRRRPRRDPRDAKHAFPARRRRHRPVRERAGHARAAPLAEELLAAAGLTRWVEDEALMDTVTALSGSGPAYVFLLAEAMQAAAEAQGLAPEAARALTLQTIHGAARMLLESGEDAATLRQRVTSPDGTTQAALESFEACGFREVVARAVEAAGAAAASFPPPTTARLLEHPAGTPRPGQRRQRRLRLPVRTRRRAMPAPRPAGSPRPATASMPCWSAACSGTRRAPPRSPRASRRRAARPCRRPN